MLTELQNGANVCIDSNQPNNAVSNPAGNVETTEQSTVTNLTTDEYLKSTKWIADIFYKLNNWTSDCNKADCKVLAATTRQSRLRQQQ